MESVNPHVELIGYTQPVGGGNPEKIVAAAAKLCYSKVGVKEITENLTEEKITEFVKMLANIHHESPLEHISFTFAIEGISRTCSHQIVRHRIASYSQQSQRYVDLKDNLQIIIPPEIKNNKIAISRYEKSISEDIDAYQEITEALFNEYVQRDNLKTPKELKEAKKKALEDARFALPNACETKLVLTMNARSLYNFFAHRCCNRAQWEIREVANQMLNIVLKIAPNVFSKAGAPCLFGKCPEGQMSCGKRPKLPIEGE